MRFPKWKFHVFVLILGLHFPAQASAQALSSAASPIWKIEDDGNYGTAFAISPNLFITNAHNLRDTKRIGEIVLSQEGSSRRLSASQILSLSLVHDLMLLQTKETVLRYLRLGGPVLKHEDGALQFMGYHNQTLTRFRQIASIPWQDRFYYALAVNRMDLTGASGSPVLNSRGEVVAIASRAGKNISFSLKVKHIKRLLSGEIGVFCPRPRQIRACRREGIAKMMAMAEQGHGFARYRLGLGTYTNEGNPLARFLRQASEQGFTMAEGKLGQYYYEKEDFRRAHHWFTKAAKKGVPGSQYMLGLIFYFARGEFSQNREKAYRYFDKAAAAGHVFSKYTKGYMLYYGQGTHRDRREGIEWLNRAAEIGDPEAKKLLEKFQQ